VVSPLQEPAKPTKSAIKKANRLARIERKQRQKLKQETEEEQQPVTPITLPQPVTTLILEEGSSSPPLVLSSLPSKAQPLAQASVAPKTALDEFVHVPAVNFDAPPIGSTTEDPPTITSTNVPAPEVKENYLEKYSPRNGSAAAISAASDNQVSRPDPETEKKRQNILTRILWTFIMIGGFIGNYPRTKCSQIYLLIFFSMQVCCSLDMPT
jgi:phosphatidate cytidylyltransferase